MSLSEKILWASLVVIVYLEYMSIGQAAIMAILYPVALLPFFRWWDEFTDKYGVFSSYAADQKAKQAKAKEPPATPRLIVSP